MKSFPEIDKTAWFDLNEAGKKIIEAQLSLIRELETIVEMHG
jgi:predicted NUDIX family NTP pyrophosphohydrolase